MFSIGATFVPLFCPRWPDFVIMLATLSVGLLVATYSYKVIRKADREFAHQQAEDLLKLIEALGTLRDVYYRHDGDSVEFRRPGSGSIDGPALPWPVHPQ